MRFPVLLPLKQYTRVVNVSKVIVVERQSRSVVMFVMTYIVQECHILQIINVAALLARAQKV